MKKTIHAEHFFFCAFSDSESVVKHVTCMGDTEFALYLHGQKICVSYLQGRFLVNARPMLSDSLLLTDSEVTEKVLVSRQGPVHTLPPTGRIRLEAEAPITLGSDYENRICYQLHSRVNGRHVVLVKEGENVVLHNIGGDGVYHNGRRAQESIVLKKGDFLQLYGLFLQFLPPYLIYVPMAGECRVLDWGFSGKERQQNAGAVMVSRSMQRIPEQVCLPEDEEREILSPPQKKETSQTPWILSIGPMITMVFPILLMSLLSSRVANGAGNGYRYVTLAAGVCSSLLGVFWGVTSRLAGRQEERRSNRERIIQYREYLKSLEAELQMLAQKGAELLQRRYPAVSEYYADHQLLLLNWNRYEADPDFWFTRLGTGRRDFPVRLKLSEGKKVFVKDSMEEEAEDLWKRFQYLEAVPVGVGFRENSWLGVVGEEEYLHGGVLQVFWQQVLHHSPEEMRVACFFDPSIPWQMNVYHSMKWVPHIWSENGETRFLAGDKETAAEILPDLTRELSAQKESVSFLIFLLHPLLILGEVLQSLLQEEKTDRVMVVGIAGKEQELPKEYRSRMIWQKDRQELQLYEKDKRITVPVKYDAIDWKSAFPYSRNFALWERTGKGKNEGIPKKVDFLELFDCQWIEDLHCEVRWQEARPEKRLKVAIGKGMRGALVYLDVHEKFHGPHGLIAGTTGSGKSELLQTYLLSLVIQFSPQDVNFFVIDYKGGGTGNAVRNFPHCAGVISNLSGGQIRRAMLAISSENKRRQRIFSQYEVNHIDAYMQLYREGKATSALPHLLIVIDEFAELKKEEPEFMQEVISLAQVGRSLGVHLLLATQKPAGTVDDKIWSNARFHLCLRVQDKQDSMDMLHKPDAAYLTTPGQCYLQIGNDELYQMFQTGYCGGRYQPGEQKEDEVVLLSESGRRSVLPKEKANDAAGSLMEYIEDYVNQVAEQNGYERAELLWLPELEEVIYLEEILEQEKEESGNETSDKQVFRIGKYDDPENQCQKILYYEPQKQGHLGICGGPATGKSHFIRLILEQIARNGTPMEAEYFLLAVEQPGFLAYEEQPHCLALAQTPKDLPVFFSQLRQLWSERKRVLNGENYKTFIQKNPGKLPILYGMIDSIGTLRRYLGETEEEFLLSMVAEGISLGVFFIITGNGVADFQSKLWNKIKTTLVLELSDPFQYGDVLRQYQGVPIPKMGVAGRGLCKMEKRVLEFQTFTFQKEGAVYREGQPFYDRIVRIPEYPHFTQFLMVYHQSRNYAGTGNRVPLGYNKETGEIEILDLQKISGFLISGADQTGKSTLIDNLLVGVRSVITDWKILLLDSEGEYNGVTGSSEVVCCREVLELEEELQKEQKKEQNQESRIVLMIPHLAAFTRQIYSYCGEEKEKTKQWEEWIGKRRENVVVIGAYHPQRDLEVYATPCFKSLASYQWGVHLGGNASLQRALEFEGLNFSLLNRSEPPGNGFLKKGSGGGSVRLLIPDKEREG